LALPRKKAYLMMKSAQFSPSSWVFQLVEFELNLGRFEKELDMMSNNLPLELTRKTSPLFVKVHKRQELIWPTAQL